jgi:hypothetical protein
MNPITPTYTVLVDSNGTDVALSFEQQQTQLVDILLHALYALLALGLVAAIVMALWLAIRVLP